jgi:deoxyribodipyrimidine photo-lyase
VEGTTRLSPHLRFGEIGPRQIWHAAQRALHGGAKPVAEEDLDKLTSEVVWRDFCYGLLHAVPDLADAHHDRRFERFPYRDDPEAVRAWRRGRTGYPIVDAGIRQLWVTG